MLNGIARNKLDEAAADRHTARACTATKCGKAAPPLRTSDRGGGTGHSSGNTAAFAVRRETHAAVELPTVLPIRILQLSPAAQQLVDNSGSIESVCK